MWILVTKGIDFTSSINFKMETFTNYECRFVVIKVVTSRDK